MFSVALSLGLPPLGVTQHRAFHGVRTFLEGLHPRDHPTTRKDRLGGGRVCVNGESLCQICEQRHVGGFQRSVRVRAVMQTE